METKFNPDEVLLYWSGELDPGSTGAVEQQLESNPAARAYFEELKQMSAAVESLPRVESSRSFAAEAVPEKKTLAFPISFRWLAVAAAIIVLAVIVVEKPPLPNDAVRSEPIAAAPKEPEKLSDRLFAYQRHAMPDARIRSVQLRARNLRSQLTSQRN